MTPLDRVFQFLLILVFIIPAFAQTALAPAVSGKPEKLSESKKFWLQKVVKDTANLTLPENRAVSYVRLGKLYWKIDKDRARALFRQSIDELNKALKEAEADPNGSRKSDLLTSGGTRQNILNIIVEWDESLGFEMLSASRSETMKKALEGTASESSEPFYFYNGYSGMSYEEFLIRQESNLEQLLALKIIRTNPNRAISILRRNSPETLNTASLWLLKALREKDRETADALAADLVRRILAMDLKQNSPELEFAYSLLSDAAQIGAAPDKLQIDVKSVHDLAEKVANFLIEEADRKGTPSNSYIIPTLLKLLPELKTELSEKTFYPLRPPSVVFPVNAEASKLLIGDAAPEKMLSEADKFPLGFREEIYVRATNRIAFSGDINGAKEILIKNFSQERSKKLIEVLNYQLARNAIGLVAKDNSEYDKAIGFIEQLTSDYSRFTALIELAFAMDKQVPVNRQKTIAILEKARALIPAAISTKQEFTKTAQVAVAYVSVEPEVGFRLLKKLLDKYIEIRKSIAIAANFSGSTNIRKNEFLINLNNGVLPEFNVPLRDFARTDFERTIKLMNKVQHPGERVDLELQTLESASDSSY